MTSLEMVAEFRRAFGQVIASEPDLSNKELNRLRINLIAEELCELAKACGLGLEITEVRDDYAPDLVGVLDALSDLQYVIDGTYLSLGFAHLKDAALVEVHRSNLTKLGSDGKPVYRSDGKVIKGPAYQPPDLESLFDFSDEEPTNPRSAVSVPMTTDYCAKCGESPDSGSHVFDHDYVNPSWGNR